MIYTRNMHMFVKVLSQKPLSKKNKMILNNEDRNLTHALVKWIECADQNKFTVLSASSLVKNDPDDEFVLEQTYQVILF